MKVVNNEQKQSQGAYHMSQAQSMQIESLQTEDCQSDDVIILREMNVGVVAGEQGVKN